MNVDLNKSLERLEQNLRDLQSAKQQVESIQTSSQQLNEVVSRYVETLGSVTHEIGELQNSIRKQCQAAENSFSEAVKAGEEHLNRSVDQCVERIGMPLDSVNDAAGRLNALAEELQGLVNDSYFQSLNNSTVAQISENANQNCVMLTNQIEKSASIVSREIAEIKSMIENSGINERLDQLLRQSRLNRAITIVVGVALALLAVLLRAL